MLSQAIMGSEKVWEHEGMMTSHSMCKKCPNTEFFPGLYFSEKTL